MPDLEVGDVVWFDMTNPENFSLDPTWVADAPFIVSDPNPSNNDECISINRLRGKFCDGYDTWYFYPWRFRKDEFLTAARKACADTNV